MPNHLANETSPYLQQHAGNPVDWYPWGDEALALARRLGRPLLLSVGYSACHWCHVMAHECFEDAGTAALMNRHFVNIKVDREERPDVDQIYQAAFQLLARRTGGWPLTMFLTPDGKPFFGGTYFPKRSRSGVTGFDDLLERVAKVWVDQRGQIDMQGDEVVRVLASTLPSPAAPTAHPSVHPSANPSAHPPASGAPDAGADPLQAAASRAGISLRDALMPAFDAADGGFGSAPKFPQPPMLAALLRQAVGAHDDDARNAVLFTLRKMAEGGLYDQLGGGFYRYSTDAQWAIPHFEKMLYDNGPLLRLYAEAWQLTREPLFRQICEGTAQWLIREMQSEQGGYFSSLDADSEGEEGRFYVWQRNDAARHLEPRSLAVFAARYGLDGPPNFEGKAWHLRVSQSLTALSARLGRSEAECAASLADAQARLFAVREARVRPQRDEKILASWNALAIDGMAFAARVFNEPQWAESAGRALAFVRSQMWREGRLLATHKDGRSHLNAYLDDHAFLLAAILEWMQRGVLQARDLQFARALADLLLEQFEDPRDGGFFFTSHDHEALIMRPKSGHDGATASGNGVAALQLQRLGHLLGEPRYLDAARRTLELFAGKLRAAPQAFPTLVSALDEYVTPPSTVTLTGPANPLDDWRRKLSGRYLPRLLVVRPGPGTVEESTLSGARPGTARPIPASSGALPDTVARPAGLQAQAWVCQGMQCLAPIGNFEALAEVLAC